MATPMRRGVKPSSGTVHLSATTDGLLVADGVSSVFFNAQRRPAVALAFNPLEVTMSADKHRGIRRQKQKRAKDRRKKRQPPPAVRQLGSSETSTPQATE